MIYTDDNLSHPVIINKETYINIYYLCVYIKSLVYITRYHWFKEYTFSGKFQRWILIVYQDVIFNNLLSCLVLINVPRKD